jgi:hypothetical protein
MIDCQSLEKLIENGDTTGIGNLFIDSNYSLSDVKTTYGENSIELNHYERYLANEIILERESPKPKRQRRKPNGVGFKIRGYVHAEQIIKWPQDEESLRTLVYDVKRDAKFVESLDYKGLRHQYYRIRGVAKNILSDRKP